MSSPSFDPLSLRIAESDPGDTTLQSSYAQRVRSLQEALERNEKYALAAQLDVAVELTGYLARGTEIGPQQILDVVARAVERVEEALNGSVPAGADTAGEGSGWEEGRSPAPDADACAAALPTPHSLRLQNEKLLGEILVQLGFLDEEQLGRGLQLQRATGERIGETLVSLGILTWEKVERAREIQERLKRACIARR